MKRFILFLFTIAGFNCFADTMDHYMNIANQIPQMEMKADPQSQAWARSARTVLQLTCDSIVETLILANDTAKAHGSPLFCLPAGTQISALLLNDLIQQTYKQNPSQQSEKDKMTVSQVALMGLSKQYPCNAPPTQANPFPTQSNPFAQPNNTQANATSAQPNLAQAQANTNPQANSMGGIAPPTSTMAHVGGAQ